MLRNLRAAWIVALAVLSVSCVRGAPGETEILWDTWGVPHVYGEDVPGLFYAFGWAQMASHGDLLLRMYGEARGRAAEYWGEDHLDADRWMHTMDVPTRAQAWYEAQSPEFRGYVDSFAAGINAYAREHGDMIDDQVEVVLPVNGVDVLAHVQRALHLAFYAGSWAPSAGRQHLAANGSNGWAIGPTRAAAGNAMLLANPHLSWSGISLFYEAHLVAPGVDMYGATLIGLPVLVTAFNDSLGWTHTVNATSPVTLYELTLEDGGYRFDGEVRRFEERVDTMRVLADDGTTREETQRTRWSAHGPVVAEQGDKAIALRAVGFDAPGLLEQWWDMGRAENLVEFEAALRQQQVPVFTTIYADRDGHILHHFGGRVPVRDGDFLDWRATVKPGDSSRTLWTEIHSYDELPRVLDPPSGWLQNANDVPWTTTFPPTLNPEDFAPSITADPTFWARGQRAARMLSEDEQITFDEFVEYKHSTRMELADLILDDLILAARQYGGQLARTAADVLEAWDREADADSRGAVLFVRWGNEVMDDLQGFWGRREAPLFSTPWSFQAPFTTPDGLADPAKAVRALERAASKVESDYGALDVPWGDVYRLRGNGLDLPGHGSGDPWGVSRAVFYQRAEDGSAVAVGGDTYVAVVEFSDPVRARVLLTYGNATQPHSSHVYDQLELFARKELRDAWLTRAEVEAHLEFREVVSRSPS